MVAKYGDKSVYFDLEDIGNTTGQWDLYGSDAPSPYNSLQVYISFICKLLLISMFAEYFSAFSRFLAYLYA